MTRSDLIGFGSEGVKYGLKPGYYTKDNYVSGLQNVL